jgi:hypothetical protein
MLSKADMVIKDQSKIQKIVNNVMDFFEEPTLEQRTVLRTYFSSSDTSSQEIDYMKGF